MQAIKRALGISLAILFCLPVTLLEVLAFILEDVGILYSCLCLEIIRDSGNKEKFEREKQDSIETFSKRASLHISLLEDVQYDD